MTLYPTGYGTQMITLADMQSRHAAKMHNEFARRLFAWIESEQGRIGIGGGWRASNPTDSDGGRFAPPGASFHESQTFASGIVGYAAVDLVVAVPGRVHRSPTWAEVESAKAYGIHAFITTPKDEPWHVQPIEMRGHSTWVKAGRPDPPNRTLPGGFPAPPAPTPDIPTPPPETPQEFEHMLYLIRPDFKGKTDATEWLVKFDDGHIERALGSTISYATAVGLPIVPETSKEHYDYQLDRRVLPPMPVDA